MLNRIQELPEEKRKIILWTVIILLGAGLLFWWGQKAWTSFGRIKSDDFKQLFPVQGIKQEIDNASSMESPTKDLLNNLQQSLPSKEELEILENQSIEQLK